MTGTELTKLQNWYWRYSHDFKTYGKLCGGRQEDGFAFISCSYDKIRSWYFYQKKLKHAKILSPRCQKYTVAGFVYHVENGVRQKYFKVYTDQYHMYECPVSLLEKTC